MSALGQSKRGMIVPSRISHIVALAAVAALQSAAFAQSNPLRDPDDSGKQTDRISQKKIAPADEPVPASLADQEKLLRKVRAKYLGSIRKTEIRQIGLAKLREFTDPLIFPKMLEIFARDKEDVRNTLLDHFADQKSGEGDATLAWCAVFGEDEGLRGQSSDRLVKRVEVLREQGKSARASAAAPASGSTPTAPAAPSPTATGTASSVTGGTSPSKNVLVDPDVPWRVKKIISNGLQQPSDTVAGAAAELAENLNLVEAIPQMINLQVQRSGVGTTGATGRGGGALAYIVVGTQQAFVSDLTPVVGDNAVAFDPTVSVLTDGTVLRIEDAVVTTYRTIIHYPLTRLANANWNGGDTKPLAFDQKKWADWFTKDFVPYREQLAAGTVAVNDKK